VKEFEKRSAFGNVIETKNIVAHFFLTRCMCILSMTFLQVNQKTHVARNFNCLVENEGLIKVTCSHVQCKRGNMSETV